MDVFARTHSFTDPQFQARSCACRAYIVNSFAGSPLDFSKFFPVHGCLDSSLVVFSGSQQVKERRKPISTSMCWVGGSPLDLHQDSVPEWSPECNSRFHEQEGSGLSHRVDITSEVVQRPLMLVGVAIYGQPI
ncbi:hypothetical protein E2C01_072001 [Portunus trituberculatus]|uniref:Uncharacterized protein n=1 Tax=Portunus trituberculatus TaxID=210409 RepID=A0A5B7I9X9_PORTR|nr:hypothetical protein [Portunus trituberculatus]